MRSFLRLLVTSSVQFRKASLILFYKLDYMVLFTWTFIATWTETTLGLNCSIAIHSQVRVVELSIISHFRDQIVQKSLIVRFIIAEKVVA